MSFSSMPAWLAVLVGARTPHQLAKRDLGHDAWVTCLGGGWDAVVPPKPVPTEHEPAAPSFQTAPRCVSSKAAPPDAGT